LIFNNREDLLVLETAFPQVSDRLPKQGIEKFLGKNILCFATHYITLKPGR